MPANLENLAVDTGLEKVSFHSIPKKGNAKECSNYHIIALISHASDFPGGSGSKASVYNVGEMGSIPGLGRFPWRRKWQSAPVLLPGQRSMVGYSTWGRIESDTTEQLQFPFTFTH